MTVNFFSLRCAGFFSTDANKLRMNEVTEIDQQAMQHTLTEGCINWDGFGKHVDISESSNWNYRIMT